MAKYRPSMPVIALTSHADVARQMNGYMKDIKALLVPSVNG